MISTSLITTIVNFCGRSFNKQKQEQQQQQQQKAQQVYSTVEIETTLDPKVVFLLRFFSENSFALLAKLFNIDNSASVYGLQQQEQHRIPLVTRSDLFKFIIKYLSDQCTKLNNNKHHVRQSVFETKRVKFLIQCTFAAKSILFASRKSSSRSHNDVEVHEEEFKILQELIMKRLCCPQTVCHYAITINSLLLEPRNDHSTVYELLDQIKEKSPQSFFALVNHRDMFTMPNSTSIKCMYILIMVLLFIFNAFICFTFTYFRLEECINNDQ